MALPEFDCLLGGGIFNFMHHWTNMCKSSFRKPSFRVESFKILMPDISIVKKSTHTHTHKKNLKNLHIYLFIVHSLPPILMAVWRVYDAWLLLRRASLTISNRRTYSIGSSMYSPIANRTSLFVQSALTSYSIALWFLCCQMLENDFLFLVVSYGVVSTSSL